TPAPTAWLRRRSPRCRPATCGRAPRGGLVAGNGARLELRPLIPGHLALQVAQLVGETALTRRAREAFLDRADQSRGAVGDDQQRKNSRQLANCSSTLWPSASTPQAASSASRGCPQMQPLGEAVDEQDRRERQIPRKRPEQRVIRQTKSRPSVW